ncbi:hypothetical protein BDA96_08G161000, partial [Sorghum bicolor]
MDSMVSSPLPPHGFGSARCRGHSSSMCILPKSGSDLDAAADSDDWDAVAVPLEALLAACVDQPAKVRKCAQEIVEKLFAYLGQSGSVWGIARQLGKERRWRVKWPKKNDTDTCKDANEVLMFLGRQALRKVIENAELYPIRGSFSLKDFFPERL